MEIVKEITLRGEDKRAGGKINSWGRVQRKVAKVAP